jgi:hypothetical protein
VLDEEEDEKLEAVLAILVFFTSQCKGNLLKEMPNSA